jgi:hypothetical protein
MSRCTKSNHNQYELSNLDGWSALTGVSLNTGNNFTCTHVVEEGDILTENCLKVLLALPLRIDLSSVDSNNHICYSGNKHGDACPAVEYNKRIFTYCD